MQKNTHYFIFILLLVLFVGCAKDDDQDESDPNKLWFSGYAETETLFYVGGEQRDVSGLILSNLFEETRLSWISVSRYLGDHYFFDGDTLETRFDNPPYNRYGYFFRNDSLFALIPPVFSQDDYTPMYFATGSKAELTTKHCLTYIRTQRQDGTWRSGSSFNVSGHETPESVIGHADYQGIDQMGPNDTLLLINQVKVYN